MTKTTYIFVSSLLVFNMGGGGPNLRVGAYFKFQPIGGALI